MKSKLKFLSFFVFFCVIVYGFSHIPTHTMVGINFEVHEETLPLYIKTLNFLSRHFETQRLAQKIVGDLKSNLKSNEAKAQALYEWTIQNIHPTPPDFTIVDDHPLHIAIRGYGEKDQMHDLFSLLCTYVGIDAFFYNFRPKTAYDLAFVKLNEKWRVFDVSEKLQFNLDDVWNSEIPNQKFYQDLLEGFKPTPNHLVRNKKQKPLQRLLLFFKLFDRQT